MCLRQQCALVGTARVATAFERISTVELACWQSGVFVVALDHANSLAATSGLVERTGTLDLPRHARQSYQPCVRQAARKAAKSGAEAAAEVEQAGVRGGAQL